MADSGFYGCGLYRWFLADALTAGFSLLLLLVAVLVASMVLRPKPAGVQEQRFVYSTMLGCATVALDTIWLALLSSPASSW